MGLESYWPSSYDFRKSEVLEHLCITVNRPLNTINLTCSWNFFFRRKSLVRRKFCTPKCQISIKLMLNINILVKSVWGRRHPVWGNNKLLNFFIGQNAKISSWCRKFCSPKIFIKHFGSMRYQEFITKMFLDFDYLMPRCS